MKVIQNGPWSVGLKWRKKRSWFAPVRLHHTCHQSDVGRNRHSKQGVSIKTVKLFCCQRTPKWQNRENDLGVQFFQMNWMASRYVLVCEKTSSPQNWTHGIVGSCLSPNLVNVHLTYISILVGKVIRQVLFYWFWPIPFVGQFFRLAMSCLRGTFGFRGLWHSQWLHAAAPPTNPNPNHHWVP